MIDIYAPKENSEDESTPLLNKLHFNQFSLKKVNEEATLKEKNGYDFTFTGNGKGAIFTLENEKKEVIQTVTVDVQSLSIFMDIPGFESISWTHFSRDGYVIFSFAKSSNS
ncbi:hypothetical protein ACEN4L_06875 [Desemzia sp. FAM 23988]|uniref:hypothetical protein n=1 Tax=Desemzia sp. FAM 23988 TaxID=3259524 RepID=UPI003884A5DD